MVLAPGVPNITGGLRALYYTSNESVYYGAISTLQAGSINIAGTTGPVIDCSVGFNAANSNAIYGASTTVQPPALSLIPQIRF